MIQICKAYSICFNVFLVAQPHGAGVALKHVWTIWLDTHATRVLQDLSTVSGPLSSKSVSIELFFGKVSVLSGAKRNGNLVTEISPLDPTSENHSLLSSSVFSIPFGYVVSSFHLG